MLKIEGLDQYSAYIGPESFQEMEASLDQEFGGVGIEVEKPHPSAPYPNDFVADGRASFRYGSDGRIQAGDVAPAG